MSTHYDQHYFDWQKETGAFGGWANQTKFEQYLSDGDAVLDFGCGGGYLLQNLKCGHRMGVEVNAVAAAQARNRGIQVYPAAVEAPDESADTIISNNALEHTLRPYDELKELFRILRPGGQIVLVVPCEPIGSRYRPGDINQHLYGWTPMCIGNLLVAAGFDLVESRAYVHKWPPRGRNVIAALGRPAFEIVCRIWGQIDRRSFQVRAIARKPEA